MPRTTKADKMKFNQDVTAIIRRLGGGKVRTTQFGGSYLAIETRAGRLLVWPGEDWIACRFEDVARANEVIGRELRLNEFTGEWCWFGGAEMLPFFEGAIARLQEAEAVAA
jgi:hypothetical protein